MHYILFFIKNFQSIWPDILKTTWAVILKSDVFHYREWFQPLGWSFYCVCCGDVLKWTWTKTSSSSNICVMRWSVCTTEGMSPFMMYWGWKGHIHNWTVFILLFKNSTMKLFCELFQRGLKLKPQFSILITLET